MNENGDRISVRLLWETGYRQWQESVLPDMISVERLLEIKPRVCTMSASSVYLINYTVLNLESTQLQLCFTMFNPFYLMLWKEISAYYYSRMR